MGLNEQLLKAAKKGDIEEVRLLLEKGADVNSRNMDGWTALMLAAWNGNTETVELLLDEGADVNSKSISGWTALMFAAANGCIKTAKFLIEKGAEVDEKYDNGETALLVAAWNGQIDIIKLLIEKGANVFGIPEYALKGDHSIIQGSIINILKEDPNINKIECEIICGELSDIKRSEKAELCAVLRKLTKEKAIRKEKALEIFREVNGNWNEKIKVEINSKMRKPRGRPTKNKVMKVIQ